MDGWTFEKSRFKEKRIGNLQATENVMTNEVFTRTFGQDQVTENLKSNAQILKADNIFSNLNLVKRQLIPKHQDNISQKDILLLCLLHHYLFSRIPCINSNRRWGGQTRDNRKTSK